MIQEEIMEVRARINEYHPGELREWLLKTLTALEETWKGGCKYAGSGRGDCEHSGCPASQFQGSG